MSQSSHLSKFTSTTQQHTNSLSLLFSFVPTIALLRAFRGEKCGFVRSAMNGISVLLFILSLFLNGGSGLKSPGDENKYIIHHNFAGSDLTCSGACHQAQQAFPQLTDVQQMEFAFMRQHLNRADDYFTPTARQPGKHNNPNKQEDTSNEQTHHSNGHGPQKRCVPLNCSLPEHAAECSNAGMTSSIAYVPLLSSEDTGYIFASISSSIAGLRSRYFSLEGPGGRSGYTVFTGIPSEGPVTLFAVSCSIPSCANRTEHQIL